MATLSGPGRRSLRPAVILNGRLVLQGGISLEHTDGWQSGVGFRPATTTQVTVTRRDGSTQTYVSYEPVRVVQTRRGRRVYIVENAADVMQMIPVRMWPGVPVRWVPKPPD